MRVGDKVFVYGTLRPGMSANGKMEKGARHLGETTIQGSMYDLGWFPGVRLEGDGRVYGDLYEIMDPELPQRLDDYENYPILYNRRVVETEEGQKTWVYVIQAIPMPESIIESGVWSGK